MSGHRLVFLAIAPSFSSTRVRSFVFQRFPLFLFLSVLPTASDPAEAGSLSPSVIPPPTPLQQALAATSASWITKDTRLTHNE